MDAHINTQASLNQKEKPHGYISSSNLVILALAAAFFPRVLMMLKIPSAINFLHFVVVPLAWVVAMATTRTRDVKQLALARSIVTALWILLLVEFASAILNEAGWINAVLHFLLFSEPFMLIVAIICIPTTEKRVEHLRFWILGFGFVNLGFALIQKFVLKWDTCGCSPGGWGDGDAIKGVFISQGSGHVVGGSVSASLAVYYYVTATNRPLWMRIGVVFLTFVYIIVSDTKQVLSVCMVAFIFLALSNVKDIVKVILYLTGIGIFTAVFSWAVANFEFLAAYLTWARPELYGPDGQVTEFKQFGIATILEHMHSPLNLWLGLGPGHTIDRLGGWMIRDYSDLLVPLGATQTTIASETWTKVGASWLGNSSSMFSPFFGWAAIWGDLGFLGLGAFLYLWLLTWRFSDEMSRFQLLTVFVNGLIFTQMQEPGYMLYVAALVGLRWQELKRDKLLKQQSVCLASQPTATLTIPY